MKFNSQICTSRSQSERLLALGLKKETADLYYSYFRDRIGYTYDLIPKSAELGDKRSIPAWSLHRLLELCGIDRMPINFYKRGKVRIKVNHIHPTHDGRSGYNHYDSLIDCIEWLIKEGYITKEEYDNWDVMKHIWGIPVWNTSTELDVWLIRNCPLDFIQDRLKEQYGGGWSKQAFTAHNDDSMYEQIKNRTSPYDTYQRNGLGKNIKVNKDVFRIYSGSTSKYYCQCDIEVVFPDGTFGNYMIDGDYWRHDDELKNSDWGSSSSHAHIEGRPKFKTLYRRLQKWDLPKGTKVTFSFWASHKHRKHRFYDSFVVTIGEKRKR